MKLSTKLSEKVLPTPAGTRESREAMILSYLPLVRLVAERVRRRLPAGADMESLVHSGVVGLLEALDRFDPERGVSFQAYARHRIHGEMIQCLRSLDSVSRSARFWSRKITTARKDLSVVLCREATSEEVAEQLGLSLDTYFRLHSKVSECRLVRLDDTDAIVADERLNEYADNDGAPHEDPFRLVERRDLMEKLREAVRLLPDRERCVVQLHHREGLTLREIGRRLRLTEGRVCQIYNKARRKLREALD
jgi:RNA polymerase sigma factor for flagellar operon FliA